MPLHSALAYIGYAQVSWREGVLYSPIFDDVYYQLGQGKAESTHVFLQPNRLCSRLQENPSSTFTVSELGFGTGLNFLLCFEEWLAIEGDKSSLNYVAYEGFPLSPTDLRLALDAWPELSSLKEALLDQYPLPFKGSHRLVFAEGRATLTLIFGDIGEMLPAYNFLSDAWFLDGFAPKRNQSMWDENVIRHLSKHSKRLATLSTYSSAGSVVRGLKEYGFSVQKISGYGLKREMVSAVWSGTAPGATEANHSPKLEALSKGSNNLPNWAQVERIQTLPAKTPVSNTHINKCVVIGSGLAGTTTALALAEAGLDCLILEENPSPMSEASGQDQLVLYGKYPKKLNREAKLTLSGHIFSQSYFSRLQKGRPEIFWNPCGVLQVAKDQSDAKRHTELLNEYQFPQAFSEFLEADQAESISGLNLNTPGLWFPKSGWLAPKRFAEFVLGHKRLEMETNCHVTSIKQNHSGIWELDTSLGLRLCEHLVIATANQTSQLVDTNLMPTKPLRGQITRVSPESLSTPKSVVCGEGYLCPEVNDEIHFGATYDLTSSHSEVSEEDNIKNIDNILKWLPTWSNKETLTASLVGGSAGLRCTTPDYTPLVGRLPNTEEMLERFKGLRYDAKSCRETYGVYKANAYINIGHGSKGMITCPVSAQHIASLISGGPSPLDRELEMMLSPARFIIRGLSKNKL